MTTLDLSQTSVNARLDTSQSKYFKKFNPADTLTAIAQDSLRQSLDGAYDEYVRARAETLFRLILPLELAVTVLAFLIDWIRYPNQLLAILPFRLAGTLLLTAIAAALYTKQPWMKSNAPFIGFLATLITECVIIAASMLTTGASAVYNFLHIIILLSSGLFLFSANPKGATTSTLFYLALIIIVPQVFPGWMPRGATPFTLQSSLGFMLLGGLVVIGAFVAQRLEKERFFHLYTLQILAADAAESVAIQNELISQQIQTERDLKESVDLQNELISRQIQTETYLKEERNLLRTMADNLPHYIYVKDIAGHYMLSNAAHTEQLGATTMDEVIGKTVLDFLPEDRAAAVHNTDLAVIQSGSSRMNDEEHFLDPGGNPHWLLTTRMLLRDMTGDITGLVCLSRDITEQKQASIELGRLNGELAKRIQEIQTTQSYLIQSEKMSSLGQMVAGIAHELNTPIGYVTNNITLVKERYDQAVTLLSKAMRAHALIFDDKLEDALALMEEIQNEMTLDQLETGAVRTTRLFAGILSGLEQMAQLVRGMRNFSRLDEAEMKKVDIHDGLRNTIRMVSHLLKSSTTSLTTGYGLVPMVECYPAQLNQVFLNLLTNALQAVEHKPDGEVTIATGVENGYAVVRITDNGVGIPADVQPKIFDPFFTTKPVGKGTGLGLSISYSIIQKHKGTLTFETEAGIGTAFILKIPATEFAASAG